MCHKAPKYGGRSMHESAQRLFDRYNQNIRRMKTPFSNLLLVAALALGGGLAHAEKADRNKPMNVEADSLRYDDIKQINIFSGRVVLTKGSITIRGARIEVRQDASGHQYGFVTAEPGSLAFFRQKREGLDEYIEGEGEVIEYDGQADTGVAGGWFDDGGAGL